jgi:hypothetical protein
MTQKKTNAQHSKAWRDKHPEYDAAAATKAWLATRPGYMAAWYAAHPGYGIAASKRHKAKLYMKLTGRKKPKVCDVCRRRGQPIHYDHCHKSKLFRGWLCRDYNTTLGYAHDSTKVLNRLIEYLTNFKLKPKVKGETAKAQKAYALRREGVAIRQKLKLHK